MRNWLVFSWKLPPRLLHLFISILTCVSQQHRAKRLSSPDFSRLLLLPLLSNLITSTKTRIIQTELNVREWTLVRSSKAQAEMRVDNSNKMPFCGRFPFLFILLRLGTFPIHWDSFLPSNTTMIAIRYSTLLKYMWNCLRRLHFLIKSSASTWYSSSSK